ncbi:MAG: DUF881 domain-containing protein [Micromonosporaceae bacterium]
MADHTPERTTRDFEGTRSDPVSWGTALRRALGRALPRRRLDRARGWSYVVPVVLFAAGVLFVTSAETARGTELRSDRRVELRELITDRKDEVAALSDRQARLRAGVESDTNRLAKSDGRIRGEQSRARSAREAAGLTALHGPGLSVSLDDAPTRTSGNPPRGATADDLVVHQQDVQAVVNALWAGGAEAMSIMGVRVISTSAVLCVGNTLLLHGQVYSPPFEIVAIGDSQRMTRALDASEGVGLYRAAAEDFGLGYDVSVKEDVKVPAFDRAEGLSHARARR